ncbi:MAG: hypothetical protein K2N60_13135 [Oscillospiraceae bacterium]|nr:hypothetical protein [Oscillospiraceae bacterium]
MALLAAAVAVCGLAGCKQNAVSTEQTNEVIEISNSKETMLIDEITNNMVLGGTEFSLPCYFSELLNKFEENEHISFSNGSVVTIDDYAECYQGSILFDNNEIGNILYSLDTNEVFGIYINVYCENYTSFSFDNINLGETTNDDIFNKYGAPVRGEKGLYLYQFGKRKDITFVFDNNILQAIIINNVSDYNKLFGNGR